MKKGRTLPDDLSLAEVKKAKTIMTSKLESLLEQVRSLSPPERQLMREALDQIESDQNPGFQERLVEAGLLSEAKRPIRDAEAFHAFTPVDIEGDPLSETIIEDRP